MLDHEGVMIQCETCKVWQHCPCVGLGDGEVTPDKYYCDSCRPENHPYRVQDGQLISGSKRAAPQTPSTASANSKAKSSKKRSTINSKDSSLSECPSVEQFCEDSSESPVNGNGHGRASKRRKKSESGTDETGPAAISNNYSLNGQDSEEYVDDYFPTDNGTESYTDSTNNSSKALGKTPRTSKPKKTINKNSNHYTSPDSPKDSNEPNDSHDAEPPHTSRKVNGRRGNHSIENDVVIPGEKSAIAKRKKVKKSDALQKDEAPAGADNYEEPSQGLKREPSVDALDSIASNTNNDPNPAPQSTVKRTGSRRGHTHTTGSETFTPSGTPQPMQPAPPAKVKYPSSRMTLKDMNKRAQQLLEYIGRVQVEMAEIKNRSIQNPLKENGEATHQTKSQGLTVDTEIQLVKVTSGDPDSRWLSTPPQSVHEMSHIDGSEQAIKAISKTSIDQTCISLSVEGNDKVPMTPPHQPTISSCSTTGEMDRSDAPKCHTDNTEAPSPASTEATSLDLMDRLTGDLIRFQSRFGLYGE
ncbi:hypothetical protein BGZ76_008880 [Entomortierella beljakovae]|nr:hypothetical protein BGZ76_008880 [Entomortierella beljakovae]